MQRDTRNTLIVFAVVVLLIAGSYVGVKVYSGVDPPFTVVNSGSMQHSVDRSSIGIIDTGDMMIVKDPDSMDIVTYVEGAKKNYSTFGEYGNVIVYKKPNQNIIHRAMIELELKSNSGGTQVWYIPSLAGYADWNITVGSSYSSSETVKEICWNESECTLTLTYGMSGYYFWLSDVGYGHANVSIKIYGLGEGKTAGYSGYLTKGDNAVKNTHFDQACGICNGLVEKSMIKSVAVFEIPWIGCIKLYLNGKTSGIPSNSTTSLIILIISLIALIVGINLLLNRLDKKKIEKEKAEKEKTEKQKKQRPKKNRK